jgi:hypothetical protein
MMHKYLSIELLGNIEDLHAVVDSFDREQETQEFVTSWCADRRHRSDWRAKRIFFRTYLINGSIMQEVHEIEKWRRNK